MSTQVNSYVMYGVVLPYELCKGHYVMLDPYMDSPFKPEVNPKDGLTVLFDGLNGKYVAIGHVVAKTENHQHFDAPIKLPVPYPKDTALTIKSLVGSMGIDPEAHLLRWVILSHYR